MASVRNMLCAVLLASLAPPAAAAKIEAPAAVKLEPLAEGEEVRPVQLSKMIVKLNRGEPIGRLKVGLICVQSTALVWKGGRAQFDADELNGIFKEELDKVGFDVVGSSGALFDEDGDRRAEYLVGGTVKSLFVDACLPLSGLGDVQSAKGSALMEVDWQIYSRLDRKVVGRATTKTGYTQPKTQIGGVDGIVLAAFAENARALVATRTLHHFLVGAPTVLDVARTAPTGITPIAFAAPKKGAGDIQNAIGGTVIVTDGSGHGSGFLISPDGLFLTNRHVVGAAKYVKLIWSDKVETLGEVLRTDAGRDVALVRSQSRNRAALRVAALPVVGQPVYAIGAPLERQLHNTVTRGIVSAVRVLDGYQFIQSDASVLPGNSGGPLINDNGDVVGMAVAGMTIKGAPQGLNLFIPIEEAISFLGMKPGS